MLLIGIQLTFAQWTKEKGNAYLKASVWYLEADEHFTNNGETDPNATRGNFFVNIYGEYGITKKLDAVAFFPVYARIFQNQQTSGTNGSVIEEEETINSIGDFEIGLRYGLISNEKYALSTSLILGIPTGEDAGGSNGSFQTGDGEFNQFLKIDFGLSFRILNKDAYFKAHLGFNQRSKGFSDEIRYGSELGWNILRNKLWVSTRLSAIESLQNGDLNAQNNQGSIFANNIEHILLGGELSYYIQKKWGLTAHYDGTLRGELVYAAPRFGGGIFFDLD